MTYRACGSESVLCEIPGTGFDREATYTILGVEWLCAEKGIRTARIDPEGIEHDWVELGPAGRRLLHRFWIARDQEGPVVALRGGVHMTGIGGMKCRKQQNARR